MPNEAERPALEIALLAFAIKFGDAMEAFLCRLASGQAHVNHLPMGNS